MLFYKVIGFPDCLKRLKDSLNYQIVNNKYKRKVLKSNPVGDKVIISHLFYLNFYVFMSFYLIFHKKSLRQLFKYKET